MKNIFRTNIETNEYTRSIFFNVKDKKAILSQFDGTGVFIDKINLDIKDNIFTLKKADVYKAVDIIKNPSYKVVGNNFIIHNESTEIKLKISQVDSPKINDNYNETAIKELDKNFIINFNKAANFASINNVNNMVLNGVNVVGETISATNNYVMTQIVGDKTDIKAILPKTLFSNFTEATKYTLEEDRLVLFNADMTKVFKPQSYEGNYPNIRSTMDKFKAKSKEIKLDKKELKSALDNASKLGHTIITLTNGELIAISEEVTNDFKQKVLVDIESNIIFDLKMLKTALIGNKTYANGKFDPFIFESDNQTVVIAPQKR